MISSTLTTQEWSLNLPVQMWHFTKGTIIVLRGFKAYSEKPFPTRIRLAAKDGIQNPFAPFEVEIPTSKDKKHYLKHDLNIIINTASMPFTITPIVANTDQQREIAYQLFYDKIGEDGIGVFKKS